MQGLPKQTRGSIAILLRISFINRGQLLLRIAAQGVLHVGRAPRALIGNARDTRFPHVSITGSSMGRPTRSLRASAYRGAQKSSHNFFDTETSQYHVFNTV